VRILYVSHYFPPEMGAPAGRVSGLARLWHRHGHEVWVLTGFPNHPTGKIHPDYRARFRRGFLREELDGVQVLRTWILPAANRGRLLRSANYLSFLLSAAVSGGLSLPRPDVIVGTSPQLLCAAAGLALSKRFGVPWVMEVRDLWPESLVAVGASGERSALVRALERVARGLYGSAAHVVTVTEAQRLAIVAAGIPAARVTVVPNGVDEAFYRTVESLAPRHAADPDGGPFVVTYIGTLGMAHGLETLLAAAERLRGDGGIVFRLVGEGARRDELEREARSRGLDNVDFVGEKPRHEVPHWIAASDLCLVLLRKTPVFETVVPSKMLEIMAVGRPIVLGVRGEAQRLLERAGAGLAVEPDAPDAVVAAIRALRADPARRAAMASHGRDFVRREFLREPLASCYLDLLQKVARPRRP
jgi:glycosyltransferase involved in cell wall biosynthesis